MICQRGTLCGLITLVWLILFIPPAQSQTVNGNGNQSSSLIQARQQFQEMAVDWLEELQANLAFSRENPEFFQTDRGIRAQYIAVHPETLNISVTRSDSELIQYLGILSYDETKYMTPEGNSKEQIQNGPFHPVFRTRVTVFFVYQNGIWLN